MPYTNMLMILSYRKYLLSAVGVPNSWYTFYTALKIRITKEIYIWAMVHLFISSNGRQLKQKSVMLMTWSTRKSLLSAISVLNSWFTFCTELLICATRKVYIWAVITFLMDFYLTVNEKGGYAKDFILQEIHSKCSQIIKHQVDIL